MPAWSAQSYSIAYVPGVAGSTFSSTYGTESERTVLSSSSMAPFRASLHVAPGSAYGSPSRWCAKAGPATSISGGSWSAGTGSRGRTNRILDSVLGTVSEHLMVTVTVVPAPAFSTAPSPEIAASRDPSVSSKQCAPASWYGRPAGW